MGTRARREREKQQRKNTILKAANALFWEKGYDFNKRSILCSLSKHPGSL